jgi:hypothetical protein
MHLDLLYLGLFLDLLLVGIKLEEMLQALLGHLNLLDLLMLLNLLDPDPRQELELSFGKLSVSLLGVKLLHMDPALRSSPPLSMAHWR